MQNTHPRPWQAIEQGRNARIEHGTERERRRRQRRRTGARSTEANDWQSFPTQHPLHRRDDGIPRKMAIFVVNELRDEISKTSKENRIENVPEMWQKVQSQEIWEAIRRLYSLESQEVLLKTMQLYQRNPKRQIELSPFSKEVSKKPLQILQTTENLMYTTRTEIGKTTIRTIWKHFVILAT